jgi:multiple sugar transport system substrate-binding protein
MKRSMEFQSTSYPWRCNYSLKAFEEAGLSESDIPKTWDQFLEIAHRLTKGNRFGCLFQTAPGYYQTFTWYPFMWQGGGEIATPDGKRSAFASPATVQALKFWQDAIQQNVAPRNILGNDGGDIIANLASGFCAMQNLGTWGVSAMREFAKDFRYGVFPLPLAPNGQQRNIFGGWAFVANAKGKIPRKRQSSVFGQWVPCMTIPFKESLTGVSRRTVTFRRENRLWKKGPPKEDTAALR